MRNALLCCLLACAACGSKKESEGAAPVQTAGSGSAGAGSAGAGSAVGSGEGVGSGAGERTLEPERSGAMVPAGGVATRARQTRVFDCAFLKFDGEGKDRKTIFKLKSNADRVADAAQSWIYYYDEAGKLLSRYPHRFFTTLAPGASEDQALGQSGTAIPESAATIECEISEVDFKDQTEWENANLRSHAIDRPRGGFTHEQLLEREGERVTATWTGEVDGMPVLALKNISARPLSVRVVWVYQYDEAGKQLDRAVANVSIDLEPGAQTEQKLGPKGLKPDAKYVEAVVSEVRFRDGKREPWLNDNLVPLGSRAMQAPLPDQAAGSAAAAVEKTAPPK